MKTILLNPGPVTLSARVRAALNRPDLCHREPEFAALQSALRDKLLRVYGLDAGAWAAVLLTGSGTAAVEAMLVSCVPADGRLLIVENGVYGERMQRIATAYGIAHERLVLDWGAEIEGPTLATALDGGAYTHVAVVHHETTTGRLNDLAALAGVCRDHGVEMLLDGVSSFGAEAIEFDGWPVAACAATANKCLHGVPGTAFVVVRRDALATVDTPRSVYLDLTAYLRQQDQDGTPFTQSVQTFYALDEALDEFFDEGGRSARHALFTARMQRIRDVLIGLGVSPLLNDGESSCVLHGFCLPPGKDYTTLHAALKESGFIIYAGQGNLAADVFRVSAMGDISDDDLARLETALRDALT